MSDISITPPSPYELFSVTIDCEYTADEIKAAAEHLGILEGDILKSREMVRIVAYLEDGEE